MSNTSFEEKSVWIQLIGLVAVLGAYFVIAGIMLSQGITDLRPYVPLFCVAVALLVIVLVAGHVAVALASKPEGRDERDRLIGWRAESNSAWILGASAFMAVTGMVLSIENVWIAHFLMLCMMLSEIAKCGFQLLYYRRGM